MRLAVSNIAWTQHDDPAVLAALHNCGVTGIEIAPTKVWPDWEGATPAAAKSYAHQLADEGFSVPAMQAILFGRPDFNIFGDTTVFESLRTHIRSVAELAACLGARALVFGAPRNRDRGALQTDDAFRRAVDAFRILGEDCEGFGACLCIEANPVAYGCNFITTAAEAAHLVNEVGTVGFGLHLDAAGMYLEGEDGPAVIRGSSVPIHHYHASEPQLGPFDHPRADHAELAAALKDVGYAGWVSIEMRASETDELEALKTACKAVVHAYQPALQAMP